MTQNGMMGPYKNLFFYMQLHDNTCTCNFQHVNINPQFIIVSAVQVDKCNVGGYIAWCLLDTFEWSSGYHEKFGLYQVDFDNVNRTRTQKQSGKYYATVVRENGFKSDAAKVCQTNMTSSKLPKNTATQKLPRNTATHKNELYYIIVTILSIIMTLISFTGLWFYHFINNFRSICT